MKRAHWIAIVSCALLYITIWFGFDRKPNQIKQAEKSRLLTFENISIQKRIDEAVSVLSAQNKEKVRALESFSRSEDTTVDQSLYLERLASFWFQEQELEISSHFAEEIAKRKETAESWAICGTTYVLCAKSNSDDEIADYCRDKAIVAFENSISLEPENIDHKINLALAYVTRPMPGEPMKGVLQLIQLNQQFPEDTNVLFQLARLSIQTGQLENAMKRLGQILILEPSNRRAHCMLVDVHKAGMGVPEFEKHLNYCNAPSGEKN